jgi:hypothetical protein
MPLTHSISATREGIYELTLSGQIHRPHWVVQLFYALSQLQVSIISGDARQVKVAEWNSKFVLDFSNSSVNPLNLDYSGFAERDAALNRAITPKLSGFKLDRRTDQLLDLRLEGPDQIGFLASVLGKMSGFALFPSSMEIRTVAGKIHDSLILRGIGERPPSDSAQQSFTKVLSSFVV